MFMLYLLCWKFQSLSQIKYALSWFLISKALAEIPASMRHGGDGGTDSVPPSEWKFDNLATFGVSGTSIAYSYGFISKLETLSQQLQENVLTMPDDGPRSVIKPALVDDALPATGNIIEIIPFKHRFDQQFAYATAALSLECIEKDDLLQMLGQYCDFQFNKGSNSAYGAMAAVVSVATDRLRRSQVSLDIQAFKERHNNIHFILVSHF